MWSVVQKWATTSRKENLLKNIQASKKNVAPKILGKAGRKAKSESTITSSYDLVSDFSGDTYSKVEENVNVQKQQW